jgi:8-oxo-dGTP pyrophosphatase MutT (NUDIX family)
MKLDCRTAIILKHPTENRVLLLKRAPFKELFPNLITGIGGKVELEKGEDLNIKKSLIREFKEETEIDLDIVENIQLRLTTMILREEQQVIIFWYTARLKTIPIDLSCNEGELGFYDIDNLPLENFTPPASKAIPFILAVEDSKVHNGIFREDGELIIN